MQYYVLLRKVFFEPKRLILHRNPFSHFSRKWLRISSTILSQDVSFALAGLFDSSRGGFLRSLSLIFLPPPSRYQKKNEGEEWEAPISREVQFFISHPFFPALPFRAFRLPPFLEREWELPEISAPLATGAKGPWRHLSTLEAPQESPYKQCEAEAEPRLRKFATHGKHEAWAHDGPIVL